MDYKSQFYQQHSAGSRRSARAIVPLVLDLVQPRAVVDVGCGVGTWLSVFQEFGVQDILGVDGDWVERKLLEIPHERFVPFDLRKPLRLDRAFDLVVSLEVAEHLAPECASTLAESLVQLGPIVLFSAAIPFQRGTHHVNEQWPEYWAGRFAERGYRAVDALRKKIWSDDDVEWHYAQNILMFVRDDVIEASPKLKRELESTSLSQLSLVHPKKYLAEIVRASELLPTIEDIAALVPAGGSFILVDHEVFRSEVTSERNAIPFLERDGQYWGVPLDDATAIHELERLRQAGADFIVFGWPAFWWLEHYSELRRYLDSSYRSVLRNERLVAFDLRS